MNYFMKKFISLLLCVSFLVLICISGCAGKGKDKCEHTYCSWSIEVEPDCINAGSKSRTCSKCGQKEVSSLPALGHNYVNGACTVCGAKETE